MPAPHRSLPLLAIVLAAVVVGAHARVVLGDQTWDDVRYHAEIAPPRLAAAAQVQAGAAPAWWDGSGLGVPLAAEPSHGAMYPPTWIAATPRALDALAVLHLWWLGLGVAVWARRRGATEPAALVGAILVATSGIAIASALRGALVALAHLPWIAVAASTLGDPASDRRARDRAAIALGVLLGVVGLAGSLAALVDAVALACALAARRGSARPLAVAIAAGLAIAGAQWIPAALHLAAGPAGAEVAGLPLARLVELVVPGSFGARDPGHAIAAIAGDAAWAPSLHVGIALLALAAVGRPARRVVGVLAGLLAVAAIAGRGGWPHWLGAPELHLAAALIVLGAHAAAGVDAVLAGDRRALAALGIGVVVAALALVAVAALAPADPDHAGARPAAIDRGLLHGALGAGCAALAGVIAWPTRGGRRRGDGVTRRLATPVVLALLALPSIASVAANAPVAPRDRVEDPPPLAIAARGAPPRGGPLRLYRPEHMFELPRRRTGVLVPNAGQLVVAPPRLDEATATLAGAVGWRWGLAGARSDDPARLAIHDRVWVASASEGGALLDRFGIGLAIVPSTLVGPRHLPELARRGAWSLVALEVAPPAAVLRGWSYAIDPEDALALLFPVGGGTGVLRGTTVLRDRGDAQRDRGPPLPCAIERWEPGDLSLDCQSDVAGYAAVSSSPAPGWSVTIDGADAPWLTADVMRRAVAMPAGRHRIAWRYVSPGWIAGLVAAAAGLALLAAVAWRGRAR